MSKVQLAIVVLVSLFSLIHGGGDSLVPQEEGELKPDARLLSLLDDFLGTTSDYQRPPDCRYISVLNIFRSKLT